MPRSAKLNLQMQEKSRNKIKNTALKLFSNKGVDGTSIRMIAGKAGISLGLLYNYFKGKEDLLQQIFLEGFQEIRSTYEAAARMPETDQLQAIISQSLNFVHHKKSYYSLFYKLYLQPEYLGKYHQEMQQWENELIEGLIFIFSKQKTSHPEIAAQILYSTLHGIGQQMVLQKNFPIETVIEKLAENYRISQPARTLEKPSKKKPLNSVKTDIQKDFTKKHLQKNGTAKVAKQENVPLQFSLF